MSNVQCPMSKRSTDGKCDITRTIWGSLSQNECDSYSAGNLSGNGCHYYGSICCFTRRGRSCRAVADRTDPGCVWMTSWGRFLGHQAGLARSGKIAARRGRKPCALSESQEFSCQERHNVSISADLIMVYGPGSKMLGVTKKTIRACGEHALVELEDGARGGLGQQRKGAAADNLNPAPFMLMCSCSKKQAANAARCSRRIRVGRIGPRYRKRRQRSKMPCRTASKKVRGAGEEEKRGQCRASDLIPRPVWRL
jgi:hypothetical protein